MALPNGTFLKKEDGAGTATSIPTMLIGGKEYAVVLDAGVLGHVVGSLDTFTVLADNVTFAQDKQMLTIMNSQFSGTTVRLEKLYLVDLQLAGITTGAAIRLDAKRITAVPTPGTTVTPVASKTDSVLALGVNCTTSSTVTEGPLLFPITITTDEVGAAQNIMASLLLQATNWLPEGLEIAEITLREGEGFTIKCMNAPTGGSLGIILVFTAEPPSV